LPRTVGFNTVKRGQYPLFLFNNILESKLLDINKISALINDKISETQLFLVELLVKDSSIKVILDGDKGVALKDCVTISKYIENSLDRDLFDFSLEVTSAGVGQPLMLLRQYENHMDKEVIVTDIDGKTTRGVLIDVNTESVTICKKLSSKKRKKQLKNGVADEVVLLMKNINHTKATVSFKNN